MGVTHILEAGIVHIDVQVRVMRHFFGVEEVLFQLRIQKHCFASYLKMRGKTASIHRTYSVSDSWAYVNEDIPILFRR